MSWWNDKLPNGKLSNYKYYKDIDVAVCVNEFHHTKGIKLILIITYSSDLFESSPLGSMSFQWLLTTYCKDIGVGLRLKE